MRTSTRILAAVMLWCGCAGDDGPPSVTIIDASVDAPPDAPPDAPGPSMEILNACMHACEQLAGCAGGVPSATCVPKCAADLADCTPQQVMDVETCAAGTCGQDGLDVQRCLLAIECVGG